MSLLNGTALPTRLAARPPNYHPLSIIVPTATPTATPTPTDRPLAAGVRPAASHVTNYARNEDTWVWGLERLAAHFDREYGGPDAWRTLWREMRRRAALSIAAALPSLQAAHAWLRPPIEGYGFQMVGLDFLIDEHLEPWLLEFNSAPSIMAVHAEPEVRALIRDNKAEMLHDVVAMVAHRLEAGDPAMHTHAHERRRARPMRPVRRAHAGASAWRHDLEQEMARRGGFEPLMPAFPYEHPGVPWQAEDRELREMWQERGWEWEA